MADHALCAVVVGAGGFGRHYARILSRLNAKALPGVPEIRRLVLSRTDRAAAEAQARAALAAFRPDLLSVDNPLKQNIVSVLRGETRTIASQRPLAALCGALSG